MDEKYPDGRAVVYPAPDPQLSRAGIFEAAAIYTPRYRVLRVLGRSASDSGPTRRPTNRLEHSSDPLPIFISLLDPFYEFALQSFFRLEGMTQYPDMTTWVEKTGKLPHGAFADGNKAQRVDIVGPSREHSVSGLNANKSTTERTKKRRKREAARIEDDNHSSLPSAKKARTENVSGQDTAFENPIPTQDDSVAKMFSSRDLAEIERHLSPSIMESLVEIYEVTRMNVISSSKIKSKVTTIIEKLSSFSFVAATKPNIVLLHAKSAVASKLLTIVQITKRDIETAGGKWYQYNILGQILTPQEKKSAAVKGRGFTLGPKTEINMDAMEVDGSEISFETMKTPLERAIEGQPKVQTIPVMLIFLSRVRSEALKGLYGEQTNALS